MELVSRRGGLHRLIREGSINRPSLALTGFFKISRTSVFKFWVQRDDVFSQLPQPKQVEIVNEMAGPPDPRSSSHEILNPTPAMLTVAQDSQPADLPHSDDHDELREPRDPVHRQ